MFQTVELGQSVDKATYKAEVPALRMRLIELQNQLKEAKFSVLIIIAGVEGAGKSETVKVLHEWMDPRFIETHGFARMTEEESHYPAFWRFWKRLPAWGRVGIFFGSWYTDPLLARAYGEINDSELTAAMDRVNALERELVQDGTLVLKFWFHMSREAQKKRLKKLAKDPEQSWRITKQDWVHFRRFDGFRPVAERVLGLTGTAEAPWTLVEGTDKRFRNLSVAKKLCCELEKALEKHAKNEQEKKEKEAVPIAPDVSASAMSKPLGTAQIKTVLSELDLSVTADPETYEDTLEELQTRFGRLCRQFSVENRSAIFVFEGADAAGKGGVIRRLAGAMDARHYAIVPVAAPTDEEKAHHYLWRFWRQIPRPGKVTIFDRSWYGRVLVERVEGFASADEWSRAYGEINEFERQLVERGIIVEKFWLQIDQEEQLRRFRDREETPWKKFKITPEDWRNREKWGEYELAVHDMVEKTGTSDAPWNLVPSNDKHYARLFTLRKVCERMERQL